jgi:MoxR-like ATPase
MAQTIQTNDLTIYLAEEEMIPSCKKFIGREKELRLCRAAWAVNSTGNRFIPNLQPLNFRLEGPPGVGKNEIVYEILRNISQEHKVPFYSIQGHEEMTPEDLSILLAPSGSSRSSTDLILRASPLATAIYEGGIFFFDEINRVPEKALSPLASVLDGRKYIYSAMTGVKIEPKDEKARSSFRFCCALNPGVSDAGQGVLPDYIEQRTLPSLKVDYHSVDQLLEIILGAVPEREYSESFKNWYFEKNRRSISTRQALTIINYAVNLSDQVPSIYDAIKNAATYILKETDQDNEQVEHDFTSDDING